MRMNVTCDEDHIYRADGVVVPGVTECLSIFADYARVPRGVLEHKRQVGKMTHRAIELYAAGELDPNSVDDAVQPFLESYIRFTEVEPLRIIRGECIVYSKKYGFAGRLDIVAEMLRHRKVALIDAKCCYDMPEATALQTAAYEQADIETHRQKIDLRAGLQLKPDGAIAELYPYKERSDLNIFLNALAIKKWVMNHG